MSLFDWLNSGLTGLALWQMVIVFLVATQVTIMTVTIYLHRCAAHRGLDLHPALSQFFRFWSWFTTGMVTQEWVAVHRKHHAFCETEDDPHSPQTYGILKVLFHGVQLYSDAGNDEAMVSKYSVGCPDDWMERNVYQHWVIGPALMLIAYVAAFGVIGISFWALHIIWIPLFAAGMINGLGHWWGYRNFATEDTSHNLVPWGVVIGGEELHNNHHAFPSSAKFALRRWEFDIGWVAIRILQAFRLARVRRVAPKLSIDSDHRQIDLDTLRAVFILRFEVMAHYCRKVIVPVLGEECARAGDSLARMRRRARKLLTSDRRFFDANKTARLEQILEEHRVLETVYAYRMKLQALWDRSSTDPETLLAALREWCREAEASGIRSLQEFARSISTYRLGPQPA